PALVVDPADLVGGGGRRGRPVDVGREEGVAGEDVLDVHQQQLLMLLFVVQPEDHQVGGVGVDGTAEEVGHGGVDVGPVAGDVVDAGSGHQAPLVPGVP